MLVPSRKFHFKKLAVSLGLITLLIVLSVVIIRLKLLAVKEVEIIDNVGSCVVGQQIKDELKLEGLNIFSVEETLVKDKLLKKFPCLKNVWLERDLPSKIKLTLISREAKIIIKSYQPDDTILLDLTLHPSSTAALLDWSFPNQAKDSGFLVDDTGLLFSETNNNYLPLVLVPEKNLKVGLRLEQDSLLNIPKITEKLENLGMKKNNNTSYPFQAKVVREDLLIDLQPKLAFSLKKDIGKQLASLQLILQKATINVDKMDTLDLRFDKPVVIYTQNP